MGGYAARSGVAEDTLDPLFCRAIVFSDRATTVALVALDLLSVSAVWAEPVRQQIGAQLACDPTHVLIAATHTHAGPETVRFRRTHAAALHAYEKTLASTVVQTAAAAHAAQQVAHLALGAIRVEGVAANRREAHGPVDETVQVLVARTPSNTCVAVIAVFGCHPTVLPPTNLRYSRDLFGPAVDTAEQVLGARVVLFNGAAADVSTRFTRQTQDSHEAVRLGRLLGEAIATAAARAAPIAGTSLCACQELVAVEPRSLPSPSEAEENVAQAGDRVRTLQSREAPAGEQRRAAAELEGALAQLFLVTHGGARAVLGHEADRAAIQLLRLGACDIVAAPGEVFSATGRAIRAARPRPTLVVGYANDYLGYFVGPDVAAAGGYEALTAFVAPNSAQAIAQRLATIDCS